MSTSPQPATDLQDTARAIEGIGIEAASPFIKSASGKKTEAIAIHEAELLIQLLPLIAPAFKKLGSGLGHLFHKIHQTHQAHQAAQAETGPAPASK